MDLLLIFISIAGVVFAAVMLLLAFRTTQMERESDARVEELQTLATGSVLFGTGGLDESVEATEAWDEMRDETAEKQKAETRDRAPEVLAPAHQFVLTVPGTPGAGQVFSFARTARRSRT